jgi:hypothetical protein
MPEPPLPSLEFLFECSDTSLQDLELAALDRSAQRLKAAKAEWNEAVSQLAAAEVARYFREHRREILERARREVQLDAQQAVLEFPAARRRA